MRRKLFTIGYIGRTSQGIECLIDTREIPISRKKGFSKSSLEAELGRAGIVYRHFQDRTLAGREGLTLRVVRGDMADLSALPDARFDLIVHPCSNMFVPDVRPVWREAFRVLWPAGTMLSGFGNPVWYLFDYFALERGELRVAHRIPYSDLADLSDEERELLARKDEPLEFGHSLDDPIGARWRPGSSSWGSARSSALGPSSPITSPPSSPRGLGSPESAVQVLEVRKL